MSLFHGILPDISSYDLPSESTFTDKMSFISIENFAASVFWNYEKFHSIKISEISEN